MAGQRTKGIRSTGGGFSGSGRSRTGEGIAAALGAVGGAIVRRKQGETRRQELEDERKFRAEQNALERGRRDRADARDHQLNIVKMLAGESKATQARLEAAQREHENLKALEQEFVSRGQEVPEQIRTQVQESEEGVGSLIGKFRSLVGKITGAGGRPEAVVGHTEDPVAIARAEAGLDATIRADEDALKRIPKKHASRAAREQAGALRERIRSRLLRNKQDKAELGVRRGAAADSIRSAHLSRQKKAKQRENRLQVLSIGQQMGIPEAQMLTIAQGVTHGDADVRMARQQFERIKQDMDRQQEEEKTRAAREDGVAQDRLDFEKMAPDWLGPADRKSMEEQISGGKAAQAFKRLAELKDKRRDMESRGGEFSVTPSRGAGLIDKAMGATKTVAGKELGETEEVVDPEPMRDISDEAFVSGLMEPTKPPRWVKKALLARFPAWDKMNRAHRVRVLNKLRDATPVAQRDALKARLFAALSEKD